MYTAMKHSLLNLVVHRQEHWKHMDIEPGAAWSRHFYCAGLGGK